MVLYMKIKGPDEKTLSAREQMDRSFRTAFNLEPNDVEAIK